MQNLYLLIEFQFILSLEVIRPRMHLNCFAGKVAFNNVINSFIIPSDAALFQFTMN